jgi:hypothetical protein
VAQAVLALRQALLALVLLGLAVEAVQVVKETLPHLVALAAAEMGVFIQALAQQQELQILVVVVVAVLIAQGRLEVQA